MPRKQPVIRKQPTSSPAMLLVDANDGRTDLFIQNAGSVAVEVSGDPALTANGGIVLAPGQSMNTDDTGAWYAVAVSGTGDLRVQESW